MSLKKCVLVVWAVGVTIAAFAAAGEPPHPGPRDRCAVCGMFVAEYPNWVAAVVLEEGGTLFFDGPKDMFRFVHEPKKYAHDDDIDRDEMVQIWVTDYYTTRMIDAEAASYVLGSDVMGPMGAELVPFATREQAESFRADHGGERVLTFQEVAPELVPR